MEAFLSQPGVGFFGMILIGLIAGYVAEKATASKHGLLTNLLVGIAGSFVGGKLAEIFKLQVYGFFAQLVVAIAGAVILLFLWKSVVKGK